MDQEFIETLSEVVEQATGAAFRFRHFDPCHGGCIHQSGIVSDGERRFFVKINQAGAQSMFASEANGLLALAKADALRVPAVIGRAQAGNQSVLVLEALDLTSKVDAHSWSQMGEGLARLHRISGQSFGWVEDNFIGKTPQSNRRHESWAEFFLEERLKFQLELASSNGVSLRGWREFMKQAKQCLHDHEPAPSLLHGDLWSGNAGFTADGEPVIYDPACYYGDRETDLAFTEFFGGFPVEFYAAYRKSYPLDSGYEMRRDLYNLYHVLNHANLFGGGYCTQAQTMMQSFIV